MGRLILNADDFGLTAGVNRAIVELHRAGVLTSASLMARAAATDEAIELALATPSLGVGCHVVLVDGEPVLRAQKLPTLVDPRTGRFHPTLGAFLKLLLTGRIRSTEIEAETAAQIALLQEPRPAPHPHRHAQTRAYVSRRAQAGAARGAGGGNSRGAQSLRAGKWSRRATHGAPWLRRAQVGMLRLLEPAFRRIVAEEGFTTTDGAIGVLATGTLDSKTLSSLLRNLPDGHMGAGHASRLQ